MIDLDAIRKIEDWKKLKFNVGLDVTSLCNLKCKMCYHSLYPQMGVKQEKVEMELWLFEKILKELNGHIESLYLSCTAEPFLHPDFVQFLEVLRKHNVPNTNIVTNGILMSEKISEAIVDAGIDELIFSIDGVTEKTFKAIRGVDIEKLLNKIKILNEIKKRRNSLKPKLRFNMILMRSNVEEMTALVELAKRYNVEGVNFQHLVMFKGLNVRDESVFNMNHKYVNELMDKALERAEAMGITVVDMPKFPDVNITSRDKISKAKPIFLSSGDFLCIKPWVAVVFTPRGDVLPCFGWFNENNMGNIAKKSFDEIWHSERYKKLREEHRGKARMREHCRKCSFLSSRRFDKSAFKEREIKLV